MRNTTSSDGGGPAAWAAVASVAAATFTVVTSEMLPVGLLTPIGRTLGVSEGVAGLALTVTGLVAAVAAPLIVPALRRADRRPVVVGLLLTLALGNAVAAWSPNAWALMAGRVLVGAGMGGVWALAASLAARLVPERSRGAAIAVAFSGVAVASVLGVPAGTLLGEAAGWRAAFAAAGGFAVVLAAVMAVLLPPLPVERSTNLRGLAGLAAEPRVRAGLVATALLVGGHFAAYTYVRPVLEDVSGADAGQIGVLLLGYGVAGVAGNFASGARAVRSPRATLLVLGAALAVTVLLVPLLGRSLGGGAALLALWGLAYGGVSVTVQNWLLAAAPHAEEAASGLLVAVFNAAIALGALLGGRAADGLGTVSVMWLAGLLAAAAVVQVVLAPAPARATGRATEREAGAPSVARSGADADGR
ncbi:MFS transporter [Actinomadura chibensis]|uniref:MFS transporter n=1 Tax=Actinomadura chibensis TaxID=392828 RepID=A0A5D0NQQ5_9ACTN|nr:MFS transporter [Actinomadura chibensis]TYB46468.1 MFS transporter [Actinomadura chibensis]